MTDQPAEDALADLEDAGLDPSYEVDPPDPAVCTVSDQSLAIDDEVDDGEPISLTLACEVPDVTSEDPDPAASTLEGAGFTSTTDTYPSDPSLCMIESQDPVGSAECRGWAGSRRPERAARRARTADASDLGAIPSRSWH